jgi:hypothetical protein
VWPDAHSTSDSRSGVDALTYGLATLVMGEEIFGESPSQRQYYHDRNSSVCQKCGQLNLHEHRADQPGRVRIRRGNNYAQYTRKFSIGNGPPDWVQEYNIAKEGGKMLGTLVALALARMPNLETFIWDMPTGVLRDVWLALASLADRPDGRDCRLERVWVRCHDNREGVLQNLHNLQTPASANTAGGIPGLFNPAVPPTSTNIPGLLHAATHGGVSLPVLSVEHPTFSCLPALRSLSVLEIDELPYLDEMSVLIKTSQDKLRELRIGISKECVKHPWAFGDWDSELLEQVDHTAPPSGVSPISLQRTKRLGGVLGVIVGRIHDIRKKRKRIPLDPSPKDKITVEGSDSNVAAGSASVPSVPTGSGAAATAIGIPAAPPPTAVNSHAGSVDSTYEETWAILDNAQTAATPVSVPHSAISDAGEETTVEGPESVAPSENSNAASQTTVETAATAVSVPVLIVEDDGRPKLEGKLKLEILELERVALSIRVLHKAFDWTIMTTLTILSCPHHELLWKMLRKTFTPKPAHRVSQSISSTQSPRSSRVVAQPNRVVQPKASTAPLDYQLRLKKVHVNQVSPALIAFLRETIPANSLEVLFLQESLEYASTVSIDAIYRGPIRRHKNSLKKLLVDSSLKRDIPGGGNTWKKWMFPAELLRFVTSGQMPAIRELGMALEYKNWV